MPMAQADQENSDRALEIGIDSYFCMPQAVKKLFCHRQIRVRGGEMTAA
jgi:hypothetical protein